VTALDAASVDVPDFAEAMAAWRVWRVVCGSGEYRLGSVVKPTLWPPGEPLAAACLRCGPVVTWFRRKRSKAHDAPAERCDCGIYGAGLPLIRQYLIDPPAEGSVLGEVSLWGTVVECERGLRASRAYPLRVYVPLDAASGSGHSLGQLLAGLEVYGVPVEPLPVSAADAVTALERKQVAALRRE
jgi:hypothetical protein